MGLELTHMHLVYICMPLLVVSVGLNVLTYFNKGKKKSNKEQATAKGINIVDFLDSQITDTKRFLNGKPEPHLPLLNNKVVALRTAYLNIEKKAYQVGVGSRQYWEVVNDRLLKLLTVFLPQLFGRDSQIQELENRIALLKERVKLMAKTKEKGTDSSLNTFDGFFERYKRSVKDQKIIDKYLSKMENSVSSFEKPEIRKFYRRAASVRKYAKDSIATLDSLHDTLGEQINSISCLENEVVKFKEEGNDDPIDQESLKRYRILKKELADAREDNTQLTEYVKSLKKRILDFDASADLKEKRIRLSVKKDKYDDVNEINDELRELSSEISNITNHEIDRLRSLLTRQRSSIHSLDIVVDRLRSSLKEKEHSEKMKIEEIHQLHTSVKDSELCIEILEKQVDELQLKLDLEHESDDVITQEDLTELNRELNRVRDELKEAIEEHEVDQDLLSFYEEALHASSLEDLAALLYEKLNDCSCEPSLEIKYETKVVVVSLSGKMNSRDRLLVDNMRLNETNIGAEGRSVKFRMLHMKGILRGGESLRKFKDNQKSMIGLIKAADKIVEKIGATQMVKGHKKTVDLCQNTIKKMAYEVDKGFDIQFKRSREVVSSSVGQLQDMAQSAGMEPQKVKAFESIKHEAVAQVKADESLRLQTRKKFLSLIRQLDDI